MKRILHMSLNYQELRAKFNISETHSLIKIDGREKDRATYSEEWAIIEERDENNQLIKKYEEYTRCDASGHSTNYKEIE